MSTVTTTRDLDDLSMVVVADFDATPEQVWELWADPRKLERWWGPPEWPATFTRHDLVSGSESRYYMTGPDGEQPGGYWRITEVVRPTRLVLQDGFTDDAGDPVPGDPVVMVIGLAEHAGGTRMTLTSTFASTEHLQQMVDLGMEEGLTGAVAQMKDVLAQAT